MTDEKKGFPFFKVLMTFCILGGLVAGGLWFMQQKGSDDLISVIKENIPFLNKEVKNKPQENTKAPVVSESLKINEESTIQPEPTSLDSNESPFENSEETLNESPAPASLENLTKEEVNDNFISDETAESAQENSQEVSQSEENREYYSWNDFLNGKPCLNKAELNINNSEIENILYSYCKNPNSDAWKKWLLNFREAKKTLIVQMKLKENTQYLKYIKIIPYLLFDIHDTKADGNDIISQLNKIETAILKRQTSKAIDLIEEIADPSQKLTLNTVLIEGKKLIKIQESLMLNPTTEVEND